MLKIEIDASPLKIIEAINASIVKPPEDSLQKIDNWTDRALPLGTLSGREITAFALLKISLFRLFIDRNLSVL